jgi:predicted DsbA family dithiol-disulfide isomerase
MREPKTAPGIAVTLYIEVTFAWCFHAEAAWDEVRDRLAVDATVVWRIALMESSACPETQQQND